MTGRWAVDLVARAESSRNIKSSVRNVGLVARIESSPEINGSVRNVGLVARNVAVSLWELGCADRKQSRNQLQFA